MEKKINAKDVLFIGLAFFASYFGAGNLIFPPKLGQESGIHFLSGIAGLSISGIALPIFAIILIGATPQMPQIARRVGKNFYNVYIGFCLIVGCMLVAIPRTAAVGTELGVQGISSAMPYIPVVVCYFVIAAVFAWTKGNALDKVGKILTPAMVIILFTLVIINIVHPIGTPVDTGLKAPLVHSLLTGYNTGDALVSFLLAGVFLDSIRIKGYTTPKQLSKVCTIAGLIAFFCLAIVYGGLLYMGACGGTAFPADADNSTILIGIIKMTGGRAAVSALGVAVVLACLTTAISQIVAVSDWAETVTKGKIKYHVGIIIVSIVSLLVATVGLQSIITYAAPLYSLMYALTLSFMLLMILNKFIPNDGGFKGAILLVTIESVVELAGSYGLNLGSIARFDKAIPLVAQGFGWVVPFAVGLVGGCILYPLFHKKDTAKISDNIPEKI